MKEMHPKSKKAESPVAKRKIGRPITVGDERINLFISPEDRRELDRTIQRSKELNYPMKLYLSLVFREGARRFLADVNRQMDEAFLHGRFSDEKQARQETVPTGLRSAPTVVSVPQAIHTYPQ